ncbi:MAG: RnfABCDGE type electron transport complex subunit G [Spirochaetaceae bacterium]|jgi:electron transport complex protein RnfG|nr:RnfABCDGE type electron transport complex subunit G [Spirochaetaceae bacterium]
MKDTIKMVAALVIFATVACVGLAFVYEGTKPVIAERAKADLDAALKEIFPDADTFDAIEGLSGGDPAVKFNAAYSAKKGGQVSGVAIQAASGGFNGDITVLVGIASDGAITGVKILANTETPGLGANAAKESYFVNKDNGITFYGQFKGMAATDNITVQKDGGKVAAITAATITSRAVSLVVRETVQAGAAWLAAARRAEGGT